MPTSSYMPKDDSGKADLLDHVAVTLPKYADILGISAEDMASHQADALNFRYGLNCLTRAQSYSHNCAAFKNQLRDGGTGSIEWPVPPSLPEPVPPPVAPGIIPRFSQFVNHLKSLKAYTPAIGQDLQIVGASFIIDPSTWKPVLSIQMKAGHPIVMWTKGKASALELWVDRNDGNGFVLLTIHTEPNTPDPLPAPGNSIMWKYEAIYLRQTGNPLAVLGEAEHRRVEEFATECADLFQRSSSAVQGRNGQLSLHHHARHRLSGRKLNALTVIHDYLIRRRDYGCPAVFWP